MSRQAKGGAASAASKETNGGRRGRPAVAAVGPSGELQALGAEVIGLLYDQAFSAGEAPSESDICRSFSEVLLRHWDLCCVLAFLRGDDKRLHECAAYAHPHLDLALVREAGRLLAAKVEATGEESHLWPDGGGNGDGGKGARAAQARLSAAFGAAGLKAGVAVPIQAQGALAGALVVMTKHTARLRSALRGVRLLGPPIIIAVGHARRESRVREQRRQIERLVEELRERSAALEEANRELQRVGRYRSLFLARMSHELRTPLTSILGFSEILLDQESLTETQRRFCQKVQASGFKLQASLNQLVDLSRLEAGHTELFLHEFSLRETLRESCAAVARLAEKQEVTLECRPAPTVGAVVSDEGKLRQVLYNFLAHAIGRSPAGETVRVTARPVRPSHVRIEICDRGEPLPDPAHLFDAVDVDAPGEASTNMNELGLVIAHRLTGALGGGVRLREAKPHGLVVRLDLPVCPTEKCTRKQ